MCFIDQCGRDPLFHLDETHVRVTKYCVLSRLVTPAVHVQGVVTKPPGPPQQKLFGEKHKITLHML